MKTTRIDILQKAIDHTSGDRNRTHGDPVTTGRHVAKMWSAYLGIEVSAADVYWMMSQVKSIRAKHGAFNLDDFEDGACYPALAGECALADNTVETETA
jgi:hypothetical protein